MSFSFKLLTDTYRCLISGSCPQHSPADVAAVLFSSVCGLVSSTAEDVKVESEKQSTSELCCISLTVIDNMNLLLTQDTPGDVTLFFETCLIKLFRDMDVMTQLVHLFQTEDQIIRHLGAKCVSTYVVYHILKSGTVDAVWQQRCVEAFLSPVPGADLDSCLWSLTDVLKRLLKSSHQEVVRSLVSSFDSSLNALCSEFLPEGKKLFTSFPKTSSNHWESTFCLLLDLLEALTASGLRCGFSLPSQRLVHTRCPALLAVISGSSQYFVKKKVLLLLKRTVLQRSGEDWTSGEVLPNIPDYQQLDADMNVLAQTVLTAVEDDWLQSIEVKSVSFFGGTGHVGGDGGEEADFVMLRAVSLLLLKSMEVHVHWAGKPAAAVALDGAKEDYGYLQRLWSFLRRSSLELRNVTHLCHWVSVLFGEQDDDMVEAAKALLSIFQHHRPSSGLDDVAEQEAACASSCNPHCHFLLLLQSISFDHSILLDFLISAETCFLDYFVRYLKHVINDWQGFSRACQRVDKSRRPVALQQSVTRKSRTSGAECSSVQNPPLEPSGAIRLVDYDSSDQSESEDMDISEVDPATSVCEKQETAEATAFVKHKQYTSSECTGALTAVAPQSGQIPGCETSARALACLSELRAVVMRLRTKKLFPYNPSSLLKLLAQVHVCSQQSSN